MKRSLGLGLSLLLLCGCTAAPSPSATPSPSPPQLAEWVMPLEQALRESREFSPEDCENLTFAPGVTIDCPDTVYQGQVMQMVDFSDQYSDLLLHWWVPDEVWDDAYYTPQEKAESYPLGPIYEDENGWYADARCTGTAFYYRDEGKSLFLSGNDGYVTSYPVLISGTQLQDSYPVQDGTLTIQQVVQMGQEFADQWRALTDYPLELPVEEVQVFDRGDGNYYFRVNYRTCFDGVPLDHTSSRSSPDYFPYASMFGLIGSVDGFSCWGGGDGGVVPHDITLCTSLLPLDAATKRLSEKLSLYTSYEVQRVALEYRLTIDGTAQTPDQYRITDEDGNLVPDTDAKQMGGSYQLYQLHPNWVFYMDVTPSAEVVCYVDALTGLVSLIDNR